MLMSSNGKGCDFKLAALRIFIFRGVSPAADELNCTYPNSLTKFNIFFYLAVCGSNGGGGREGEWQTCLIFATGTDYGLALIASRISMDNRPSLARHLMDVISGPRMT